MKKNFLKVLCLLLVLLLLPLPVRATSDATFNANAFNISGGSNETPVVVTIGDHNKAVLEQEAAAGRTAQATVSCPYDEAHVMLGNELVESTVADGKITFDIPTSGNYQIYQGKIFHIANTNMVFGNSLALNFWIRKSDLVGKNYYAVITKAYADGRAPVSETIQFADWQNYNNSYYRVSCSNIAAKEMSDLITVQIFHTDGTAASYVYTDSVRSYAMDMLKYYRSGKLATALVDMLNYGAAAQNQFTYNVNDLANSKLDDTQKSQASQTIQPQDRQTTDGSFHGSSLSLESNIVLNLYFENVTQGMNATVSFTNHYGEEKNITIPYEKFVYNENVGHYAVKVEELVVSDGRQPVTCVLYDANNQEVGRCVTSVETYLAKKWAEDTHGLYDATFKFVNSAHAYFHP